MNTERGERSLKLFSGGSNGAGQELEFRVRMTFNASCEATASLSQLLGRDISEVYVLDALKEGFINWKILRALLWASIKGQHGIETIEDAGDLMGRNNTRILLIARAVGGAFAELFPATYEGKAEMEEELRLAKIELEKAETSGAPAGN